MKTFHQTLLLGILSAIISGCASSTHQDLLSDRLEQERIYTAMKNYSDLIKINKENLQKEDTPHNRLKLAQSYYDIQDFDSTLYYIAPLLEKGKDSKAFLLQAKVLESQNSFDLALQAVHKAIALDAQNAEAYNLIGIIKTREKKFKEAEENFKKAKALFLPDHIINNNLGMLYILTHRFNEAINYLLPLYHRNFKDPKLTNNLVLALIKAGRKKEALEIINKQNIARAPNEFIEELEQLENVLEKE